VFQSLKIRLKNRKLTRTKEDERLIGRREGGREESKRERVDRERRVDDIGSERT
jgi:hypothetical protein